ncbi:MAG: hypothetical protein ACQER2_02600 [Bacillota bacterium]
MKLTNKAHSLQCPHVHLDGERVALLDRDETLDISLDAGPHTLTVNQPFCKKITVPVKDEDAYMIKGNPWHLVMHLIAAVIVLTISVLSLLYPVRIPFSVALTVLILPLMVNVASLFFVSLYRLETLEQ